MKKNKTVKLNEDKIVKNQLSNGQMDHIIGGIKDPSTTVYPNNCVLAGCGCTNPHRACRTCQA